MRLCCGFEVQINVRREVPALCCEGEDGGGGGGGEVEEEDWGTWNVNDVDFFPRLSPNRPHCLRPDRAESSDGAQA